MAVTQVYVDPAIAGNSGTGTIGDPYGDLQYALNTVTRDSTNGNQVNVKAGTAEVLAASLTLATYGTPTAAAPLIIRGYTSAANDGGIGVIDCGGVAMWNATTYDYIGLVDLELHTFGNNAGVILDQSCYVFRCNVHKGASSPTSKILVTVGTYSLVMGCYLHDGGTTPTGISLNTGCLIAYNHITGCRTSINHGSIAGATICFNLIRASATDAAGVSIAGGGPSWIFGNSIYNSAAGTVAGIRMGDSAGRYAGAVFNNIVEGWSGSGGLGIGSATAGIFAYLVGWNAFYNNATAYSITEETFIDETAFDHALGASPFVNAGTGDFDINGTVTGVTEDAWPLAFLGNSGTAPRADKGAVQAAAGGSPDYPAVGDVQDGVSYGGGTGTLVLPTEAQVEEGVGFGEDGTEFEGTLPAVASDWTSDEKAQIRQALGVTGTKAATSGGNLDAVKAVTDDLATDEEIADAVETALAAEHGSGSWDTGGVVGSYSVVYTVTVGGVARSGCYCRMTTDAAGLTAVDAGWSNSLGQVTFNHDLPSTTTVYIWRSLAGVIFEDPDIEVIP